MSGGTVVTASAGERIGVASLSFGSTGRLVKQEWRWMFLGSGFKDDPEMVEWLRHLDGE